MHNGGEEEEELTTIIHSGGGAFTIEDLETMEDLQHPKHLHLQQEEELYINNNPSNNRNGKQAEEGQYYASTNTNTNTSNSSEDRNTLLLPAKSKSHHVIRSVTDMEKEEYSHFRQSLEQRRRSIEKQEAVSPNPIRRSLETIS